MSEVISGIHCYIRRLPRPHTPEGVGTRVNQGERSVVVATPAAAVATGATAEDGSELTHGGLGLRCGLRRLGPGLGQHQSLGGDGIEPIPPHVAERIEGAVSRLRGTRERHLCQGSLLVQSQAGLLKMYAILAQVA